MFSLLVELEVLPAGATYAWSRYVLNMMLFGFPYVHAIVDELPSSAPALHLWIFCSSSKERRGRIFGMYE